jgi:hypothetical protein
MFYILYSTKYLLIYYKINNYINLDFVRLIDFLIIRFFSIFLSYILNIYKLLHCVFIKHYSGISVKCCDYISIL